MAINTPENLLQVAEIELRFKTKIPASQRIKIETSRDAYNILLNAWNPYTIELHEEFKIILMNRSNKALGLFHAASGGITGVVVDIRLLFVAALKANAVGMIVSHNHPSGNTNPSTADLELTQKLKQGGMILNIQLMDHIIVTKESYYSFADEGIL